VCGLTKAQKQQSIIIVIINITIFIYLETVDAYVDNAVRKF